MALLNLSRTEVRSLVMIRVKAVEAHADEARARAGEDPTPSEVKILQRDLRALADDLRMIENEAQPLTEWRDEWGRIHDLLFLLPPLALAGEAIPPRDADEYDEHVAAVYYGATTAADMLLAWLRETEADA